MVGGTEILKYKKELTYAGGTKLVESGNVPGGDDPLILAPDKGGEKTDVYSDNLVYKVFDNKYLYNESDAENVTAGYKKSIMPYLLVELNMKNLYYIIESSGNKIPQSTNEVFYPLMYVENLNPNNKQIMEFFRFQPEVSKDTPGSDLIDIERTDTLFNALNENSYTFTTTYEIPLKVLVERYLPRASVLSSWYMLKEDMEQNASGSTDDSLKVEREIDELITDIKEIYNKSCLTSYSIDGVGSKLEDITMADAGKDGITRYNDTSNKYTFINFARTVLEATRFPVWKEGKDESQWADKEQIYTIYDFLSAFRVHYTITRYEWDEETGEEVEVVVEEGYYTGDIPGISEAVGADGAILEVKLKDNINFILPPSHIELGPNVNTSDGNYSYLYVSQGSGYYQRKEAKGGNLAVREQGEYGLTEEQVKHIIASIRSSSQYGDGYIEIMTDIEQDIIKHKSATLPIKKRLTRVTHNIHHRYMPAFFITNMEEWARSSKFRTELIVNRFRGLVKEGNEVADPRYIIYKTKKARGIKDITVKETPKYRIDMYDKVFGDKDVRENDVLAMLIEWEKNAKSGDESAYTHIRDLYNLIMYCKAYGKEIHENAYTYVYVPEEIIEFDEPLNQIMYWTELLSASPGADPIATYELHTMRGKNPVITWQEVEYDEYPECNGMVYALNPYGSAMVRSLYELASAEGGPYKSSSFYPEHTSPQTTVAYKALTASSGTQLSSAKKDTGMVQYNWGWFAGAGGHEGGDWFGRNLMTDLYSIVFKDVPENERYHKNIKDVDAVSIEDYDFPGIGEKVYNYELDRIKEINSKNAENIVKNYVEEQVVYVPLVASAPGIVVDVRYNATSGFRVKIQHQLNNDADGEGEPYGYNDGTTTYYMHMRRWPLVQEGDYVGAGTVLGYEGTTGNSGTYHIHYEVRMVDNTPQDPTLFVYPIFNPFYYAEKAGESPEYESLMRTVLIDNVKNQVPQEPLLSSTEHLVTIDFDDGYGVYAKIKSDMTDEEKREIINGFVNVDTYIQVEDSGAKTLISAGEATRDKLKNMVESYLNQNGSVILHRKSQKADVVTFDENKNVGTFKEYFAQENDLTKLYQFEGGALVEYDGSIKNSGGGGIDSAAKDSESTDM